MHNAHAAEDYEVLRSLGLGVAREGVPWPFVDSGGALEFSALEPLIEAQQQCQILPIWELCHYGYPDDVDPFSADFVGRFASYATGVAEHLVRRSPGPHFFAPMNEITFFSFMAGEWGWAAPRRTSRADRFELRLILCKATIAACKAIRTIEPAARFIHFDPLVNVVAPVDRPDLVEAARLETEDDTYLAWDVLSGLRHPELGGSPETLDIVGANVYSFGQMEYREHGPHAALPPDDPRIRSLCDLLTVPWERYQRPMIIGETSGLDRGRAVWLRDVMQESLAAVDRGIDLHGVCLFPGVDMPDWHTGEWLHNGICDLIEDAGDLRREMDQEYVAELRRWQRLLNRVTELDEDPLSDPVELEEVVAAAKRLKLQPDQNWH